MPVIKSAIKKLRQDKNRKKKNDVFRQELDTAIRKAKKLKTEKSVSAAFSVIDKAVKKHIIHKNKAARLKSSLARKDKTVKKTVSAKKAIKKAPVSTKPAKTPKKTVK